MWSSKKRERRETKAECDNERMKKRKKYRINDNDRQVGRKADSNSD